jgi:hypothetical protein
MRKSNQAASHCGLCVCASQRASERVCLICMMKGIFTKRRARRMKIYFCALVCLRHTLTHSQKACGESRTRNSELTKFADRARTFVPRSLLCSGLSSEPAAKKLLALFCLLALSLRNIFTLCESKDFNLLTSERRDCGSGSCCHSFEHQTNAFWVGTRVSQNMYVLGYNWFPSADSK